MQFAAGRGGGDGGQFCLLNAYIAQMLGQAEPLVNGRRSVERSCSVGAHRRFRLFVLRREATMQLRILAWSLAVALGSLIGAAFFLPKFDWVRASRGTGTPLIETL